MRPFYEVFIGCCSNSLRMMCFRVRLSMGLRQDADSDIEVASFGVLKTYVLQLNYSRILRMR